MPGEGWPRRARPCGRTRPAVSSTPGRTRRSTCPKTASALPHWFRESRQTPFGHKYPFRLAPTVAAQSSVAGATKRIYHYEQSRPRPQADIDPSLRSRYARRGHRFRRLSLYQDMRVDPPRSTHVKPCLRGSALAQPARKAESPAPAHGLRRLPRSVGVVRGRASIQGHDGAGPLRPPYCVGQGMAACTVVTGPTPLKTNFCRRLPV